MERIERTKEKWRSKRYSWELNKIGGRHESSNWGSMCPKQKVIHI